MAHGAVAPSEPKKPAIKAEHLAYLGFASGMVGVYVSSFSPVLAAALAIPPILWAADAVRRMGGYGLGTGVPSIGNLSIGMGVLAAIVGLRFEPALGAGFALAFGFLYGVIIGKFKVLEIPIFTRVMVELPTGAALT
ncbi:MAG: hypothetical protein DRO46_03805, partial [Candidatus Hecatellales archaeon]